MNTFKIEMSDHADYFVFLMKQEFRNRVKWGLTKKSVDYLGKGQDHDSAMVSIDKSEMEAKEEIMKVLDQWHFDKVRVRYQGNLNLVEQDEQFRLSYDLGEAGI